MRRKWVVTDRLIPEEELTNRNGYKSPRNMDKHGDFMGYMNSKWGAPPIMTFFFEGYDKPWDFWIPL